jgi:DNA-binding response OmpR family regulator
VRLLLTDVVMPGMNGRELSERLTAMRPRTPVLFMSGYTDEVIAQHLVLDEGAQLLQKPCSVGGLLAKVKELLH